MCRHMKGFTNLSLHFSPLSALRSFVLSRNVVLSHPATQVERVLRQAAADDGYRILVCIRKLDRKNEKQPLALCQGALFPNCESPNAMTAICCLSLSVACLHLSPTHVIQLDIRCAPSIDIAHAVHGPSATACMKKREKNALFLIPTCLSDHVLRATTGSHSPFSPQSLLLIHASMRRPVSRCSPGMPSMPCRLGRQSGLTKNKVAVYSLNSDQACLHINVSPSDAFLPGGRALPDPPGATAVVFPAPALVRRAQHAVQRRLDYNNGGRHHRSVSVALVRCCSRGVLIWSRGC